MSATPTAFSTGEPAAPSLRHRILGTAGHIDHGKTSLVRALTGVDTDRLPEERRRGMTIELGFAELRVGDVSFGIVDVPGHERFVRTMVSGATGIDVALLVVAADDSVMPQTIEHVEILRLLGVRRLVAAVTKIDAVDPDLVELVAEEVRDLLEGQGWDAARIVPVSSLTGAGLDELRAALAVAADADAAGLGGDASADSGDHGEAAAGGAGAGTLAGDAPEACSTPAAPFRIAVDRVFVVQGRGTVVTGSVLCGRVAAGDVLQVWPGGGECRVRELQAHGHARDALAAGQRAAINVTGVDRERLERGAELATPGYLAESRVMDVRLSCLASHPRGIRSTATVRLEMGTAETPVRVVLLDRPVLSPGESAYAQLRGGVATVAAYGQRFILRDENATRTIGGGVVLRPGGRRRRGEAEAERRALGKLESADEADRLEEVLRFHGFAPPAPLRLVALTGIPLERLPLVSRRLIDEGRLVAFPDASPGAESRRAGSTKLSEPRALARADAPWSRDVHHAARSSDEGRASQGRCARAHVDSDGGADAEPQNPRGLKPAARWQNGTASMPAANDADGSGVHIRLESYYVPAALDDLYTRIARRLERFHRERPEEPGRLVETVLGWIERLAGKSLARPILDELLRTGRLKRIGAFVGLPKFVPTLSAADEQLLEGFIGDVTTGGFAPPTMDTLLTLPKVDRKRLDRIAKLAVATRRLVHIKDDFYLTPELEQRLRERVTALIQREGPVTVARVREALSTSRKYGVPLLEYLDRIGLTRRDGDRRELACEIDA